MCSLRAAPCITADRPTLLERTQRPVGTAQDRLGCRAIATSTSSDVRYGDGLVEPFRVFGFAAQDAGVTAGESSSCGISVSFRVLNPSKYRPHWLGDPALPLAVASTVRFSLAGPR